MPVYNYYCTNCGNTISVMVESDKKNGVRCPRCSSHSLKNVSTKVVNSRGKDKIAFNRCG
ncbi:MAG: FmdB family zinc ribbon protein [Methylocystaceae bacterium]